MATTILTVGALFQTRTSGSWPFSTMNTGRFHFVWTPTAANTDGTWGNASNFYALIAAADNGGIWIVDDAFSLFDQAGASLLSVALTWSAGAAIDVTIDMSTGSVVISGATTGNGTHSFSTTGDVFSNVTLGLGIYGGGGFNLPASTLSDIDDADNGSSGSAAGTSTATGTITGIGALSGSAAGTSTATGNFASSDALSGSAAGTSTATGTLTATGALSGSAAGVATVTGSFPSPIELGAATAEQELNAISHGGSFTKTTPSTDVTITSVNAGTDTLTSSAHGMKDGDGPYRFTSTGTLPSGLATGTDYYVIVTSTTEFQIATTGANAIASTAVAISDSGSGTHTLVRTVDTQASDSLFLAFLTRGDWAAAPSAAPTDNKGNTYSIIGTTHDYATFPNSKTGVYAVRGTGGADHTWSMQGADFDEVTVSAIEMKGATGVQTHSHVERAIGSATITSASVTTSTATMLVAVCFGNGPTGQDHTFTPSAGWTKVPAASREADMSSNGYIQVSVAYKYESSAGTFTVDWSGVSNEGGQLYLLALQDLPQDLSGATAGSSTASANIGGVGALAGSSAGTATASGTVTGTGAASGTSAGAATVTGNATATGALSGTAAGASSASGTLTATGALSGASTATSTASATIAATGSLSGSAAGTSTASGTFAGTDALSGSTSGTSTASATITGIGSMSGAIAALATAAGVILGIGALAGSAAGAATVSGATTGLGSLSGLASGASTASATITGIGSLSGSSAGTSTASATPFSENALSGSSAGTSTASASIVGIGSLAGSTGGTSDATGSIGGTGSLSGSAQGTSTVDGVATASVYASGSAAGSSSASGALTGDAACSGSCVGVATVAGTIGGIGALSGSAAGTSTVEGGGPGITAASVATHFRPSITVRVRMFHMPFHVGDNNDIDGEFRDGHTNALVDPTTVTIVVQTPTQALTNTSTTYTYGSDALLTRTSTGKYRASIPCTEAGKWEFCWKSPGPTGKATEPGYFDVVATI